MPDGQTGVKSLRWSSTGPYSPITVVLTLESAFNLDLCNLSKDGELRTECRKVQFRKFLIEVLRPEVDIERSHHAVGTK